MALSPGNELIGGEFDQPGMGFVNMKVCDACTHSDFQISLFSLWNGIVLTLCSWFLGIITSTIRNRSLLKSGNKLWSSLGGPGARKYRSLITATSWGREGGLVPTTYTYSGFKALQRVLLPKFREKEETSMQTLF